MKHMKRLLSVMLATCMILSLIFLPSFAGQDFSERSPHFVMQRSAAASPSDASEPDDSEEWQEGYTDPEFTGPAYANPGSEGSAVPDDVNGGPGVIEDDTDLTEDGELSMPDLESDVPVASSSDASHGGNSYDEGAWGGVYLASPSNSYGPGGSGSSEEPIELVEVVPEIETYASVYLWGANIYLGIECNDDNVDQRPESLTIHIAWEDEDDSGETIYKDVSVDATRGNFRDKDYKTINGWSGTIPPNTVPGSLIPGYGDGTKVTIYADEEKCYPYTMIEWECFDYTVDAGCDSYDTGFVIITMSYNPDMPILSKNVAEDDYERKESDSTKMHEGEDTDGEGWGTWDDADNNEEVLYHVTLTDIASANTVTVHDYLEEGLVFEPETIEVTLNNNGNDRTLTEGIDYTEKINTSDGCSDPDCQMDGCTFEIEFEDSVFNDISLEAYIVIEYKALTDTHAEDYVDYDDALFNRAYMQYSVGTTSYRSNVITTETDLFGFGVYKYGEVNDVEMSLRGAEFILERRGKYAVFNTEYDAGGNRVYMLTAWTDAQSSAGILTSGEDGMIHIEGLDDDTYSLIETVAPEGFTLLEDPIEIVIDEYGNVAVDRYIGTKDAVIGHVINVEDTIYTKKVNVGDGTQVEVGDQLVYTITWQNLEEEAAVVIITDELDVGLTFSSASDNGVYDEETHTVTWIFPDVEPGVGGEVIITAIVNDNARMEDEEENIAYITIGNNHFHTNKVDNPTGHSEDIPNGGTPDGHTSHHSSGGSGSGGSSGSSGTVSSGPGTSDGSEGESESRDLRPLAPTGEDCGLLSSAAAMALSGMCLIVLLWLRRKENV